MSVAVIVALSCVLSFVAGLLWSPGLRRFKWRAGRRDKRRQFWQRQSREFLHKHGLLSGTTSIPPLLPSIDDFPAAMVALELITELVERRALGPLLDRDQFTMAEMVDITKFTVREAQAAVEVLLAAGALVGDSDAFSMTLAARLYLSPDSPLCACDYPTRTRTWRLPKLIRFARRRSVNAWRKGTAVRPEQWAISMHRLSFPLGFALHSAGVLGETESSIGCCGRRGFGVHRPRPQERDHVVQSHRAARKHRSCTATGRRVWPISSNRMHWHGHVQVNVAVPL